MGNQTFNFRSDSVGYSRATSPLIPLLVGTAAFGDKNVISTYTPSNVSAGVDNFVQGPLAEDLAHFLGNGGSIAKALRINAGVDPACGSVTAVRVGSSTGTVAAAAAQVDASAAIQIDDPGGTPAYVDETTDFASAAAGDVDPWPASEAEGDQFAVGYVDPWGKLKVTIGTAGVGGTLAVKYWNGTSWTAVTGLVDNSTGFTAGTSTYDITFDVPNDWVARSINGSPDLYYVVFEVATVYSTNPILDQGQIELGGPYDEYDVEIEVTKTGTLGTAEFKYTLERTAETPDYSDSIVIPSGGIYELPGTGIEATFAAGAGPTYFELGDKFRFTCTAPYFNATDLANACAAIKNATDTFDYLLFCGTAADAATAATLYAALATQLATLRSNFKFPPAIFDVGSADSAANCDSSMADETDEWICPHYGKAPVVSAKPMTGWTKPVRTAVCGLALQAARVTLSGDLKRVKAGPVPGIGAPVHDDRTATVDLDAKRISTYTTRLERAGTFITNGHLKSGPTSAYRIWPHAMVMGRSGKTIFVNQEDFVGANPRCNIDQSIEAGNPGAPGTIYGPDAVGLEEPVKDALTRELTQPTNADGVEGHVSGWKYEIDRTYDAQGNKAVRVEFKTISLIYIDEVQTELGWAFAL